MTRQRKLKKRVRYLMEQRGLSYTAALAIVTSSDPNSSAAPTSRRRADRVHKSTEGAMREVVVEKVRTEEWSEEESEGFRAAGMATNLAHVMLREADGNRVFDILMGQAEGRSIQAAVAGVKSPRPMTHDLYVETLRSLGAKVTAARITGRDGHTFIGEVEVSTDAGASTVSARPSDAVAVALRSDASIFVAEELLSAPLDEDAK